MAEVKLIGRGAYVIVMPVYRVVVVEGALMALMGVIDGGLGTSVRRSAKKHHARGVPLSGHGHQQQPDDYSAQQALHGAKFKTVGGTKSWPSLRKARGRRRKKLVRWPPGRLQSPPCSATSSTAWVLTYRDADGRCDELRFIASDDAATEGAFKTPSLRNVALCPPYMHAGQFATLEEVVAHYVKAPPAAVGTANWRMVLRVTRSANRSG